MSHPCSSCRAPIIWAVTVTGKSHPVDELPNHEGNLVLRHQADPREPRLALVLDKLGTFLEPGTGNVRHTACAGERFMSHFATCPHADQHRKGKR